MLLNSQNLAYYTCYTANHSALRQHLPHHLKFTLKNFLRLNLAWAHSLMYLALVNAAVLLATACLLVQLTL